MRVSLKEGGDGHKHPQRMLAGVANVDRGTDGRHLGSGRDRPCSLGGRAAQVVVGGANRTTSWCNKR